MINILIVAIMTLGFIISGLWFVVLVREILKNFKRGKND